MFAAVENAFPKGNLGGADLCEKKVGENWEEKFKFEYNVLEMDNFERNQKLYTMCFLWKKKKKQVQNLY